MSLSSIALLGFIIFFVASLTTFMWFLIYTVFWSHFKGAPFVPSSKKQILGMIKLAQIKQGDIAYDLGSGSGSVLFEAAKYGADARGIEISPLLVWFTRCKAKWQNVSNILVVRKDFRETPLSDADIVFLYLWPKTNARLCKKLKEELKPGTRIISNSFVIEGLIPETKEGDIYRYII